MTSRTGARRGAPSTTPAPRRRRGGVLRHWREYLAIAPFYVLFLAFGLVPLLYAVQLSTISWDGLADPVFVGLDQFRRVLFGGEFGVALVNTVVIFFMGQVPVVIGALVAAVLLSRRGLRGAGVYQTLFFLPQVTSVVAIAVVFQSLFSQSYGIVNRLLSMVGIGPVPWLESAWGVKVVIALMIIWQTTGYFMVIFLAGLAAIDPALYEAATLDGAGGVQRFFHITLPMLRPTIIFVLVTGTISGFQLFTQPQVLLNGGTGPFDSGLTMMYLQVRYLGSSGSGTAVFPDLGYAAAIGWAIFVVLVVLAAVNAAVLRRNRRL
ncbi:ABC transporter permease subunit [Auraticoccus sp. F435]|uniref:ABC transporter permease subunit n=1 Tax=Auraticoccus cholistanensis TaxID=2656650 RepID=A0A6A9UZZ5_9ACTN|nr:ABC transporter permease subunit [Auraticoccus cholistanensis]